MKEPIMTPQEVSDVDIAFPAHVSHLMPKYAEIPEQYKRGGSWGNKLFSDMFFNGVKGLELTPKKDIDPKKAIRHIKCILGSFEPKHEHKEAAIAMLLEEWFESAKWEPIKEARR